MASVLGSGFSRESPWSRRSAHPSDSSKSPERETPSRWGRAAARTLPTMLGAGCRPSVTSPCVVGIGIGSAPKRAAATRASGPPPGGVTAARSASEILLFGPPRPASIDRPGSTP